MKSKNSKPLTRAERKHLGAVKALPCSVCNAEPPSAAHHIKQGQHFTAIALCADCHQCPTMGWHGNRVAWRIAKMDELDALAVTLARMSGAEYERGRQDSIRSQVTVRIPTEAMEYEFAVHERRGYERGRNEREPAGDVVVTKTPDGRIVAVTRQDEEGQILSVIAEAGSEQDAEPVAWMGSHPIPLYAYPPKRKPLTDEQIAKAALISVYFNDPTCPSQADWVRDIGIPFARAIEGIGDE